MSGRSEEPGEHGGAGDRRWSTKKGARALGKGKTARGMDLYGKYLFRQAVGVSFLILLALTAIVWIATALKRLEILTSKGQTSWTFLKITLLALPDLIVIVAPVALLITTIYVLARASSDSELIVMTASGATIWRIAWPFIALALITMMLIAVANFYVRPWSVRTLTSLIAQVRADLISQVLQPGQFSSPEQGLTFHIRERAFDGRVLGLFVHDERDDKVWSSYLAESGRIVKQDGQTYLVMENGHIIRRVKGKDGATIISFEQNIVDLAEFGAKASARPVLKPRARYLSELLNPDPNDPYYRYRPGKFRAELHDRFANPLYPLVFVLVAVAVLGRARTNRESRAGAIALAFTLAALARLLGIGAYNLSVLRPWAVALVYGVPLAAIAIAFFATARAMRPRKPSRIASAMADQGARLINRLAALLAFASGLQQRKGAAR